MTPATGPADRRIQIVLSKAGGLSGHGFQLSIEENDANGMGHGYRIFGPKFIGDSEILIAHTLDARDVKEIGAYLAAFTDGGAWDKYDPHD
jgi:hypothetical protein